MGATGSFTLVAAHLSGIQKGALNLEPLNLSRDNFATLH